MHSPNIELLPEMNRKSLQTYNATKPTSIFFVVFCNVRVYAGVYHVNLTGQVILNHVMLAVSNSTPRRL